MDTCDLKKHTDGWINIWNSEGHHLAKIGREGVRLALTVFICIIVLWGETGNGDHSSIMVCIFSLKQN